MAHDQLGLDLLHRVHRHTHHDQQRRAAEIKSDAQTRRDPAHSGGIQEIVQRGADQRNRLHLESGDQKFRQQADQNQIDRAGAVSRLRIRSMISAVLLPGRIPGIYPPYLRILSATSIGLKMMLT